MVLARKNHGSFVSAQPGNPFPLRTPNRKLHSQRDGTHCHLGTTIVILTVNSDEMQTGQWEKSRDQGQPMADLQWYKIKAKE
jgi:hypothetical protein